MNANAKYECEIPACVELTNISSIYNSKEIKIGIFNVSSVGFIMYKIINFQIYPELDSRISESNVGGMEGKKYMGLIIMQSKVMWYNGTTNNMLQKFALMANGHYL